MFQDKVIPFQQRNGSIMNALLVMTFTNYEQRNVGNRQWPNDEKTVAQ